MTRFIRKKKHEIGVSPDELIFRGERKSENVSLRKLEYSPNDISEQESENLHVEFSRSIKKSKIWLNIDGLHDIELLQTVAHKFQIEDLAMAEMLGVHARPRVIEYENCLLISIKMLQQAKDETVKGENLSLILCKDGLISFQEKRGDVFEPVRERLRKAKKRIRSSGEDYLVFALLDVVIDNYLYVISLLGDKIESIEGKILEVSNGSVLNEISVLKRELNYLRKSIIPAKEMILNLSKIDSELIDDSTSVHLKELQNNISHAIDSTESYREILSDQLNIHHTISSSKLNDVMKFLTVFSVIFIPLSFVAGVYGTNFDYIPGIHDKEGFALMWGSFALIVVIMLLFFKRKKWL